MAMKLTHQEKQTIVSQYRKGRTIESITEDVGVSERAVFYVVAAARQKEGVKKLPYRASAFQRKAQSRKTR